MIVEKKRPKVGLGVIIRKDGKVLLGKRKNSHGDGCWQFPGGHLEYAEGFEECAVREVAEETGIKIKNIKFITITNDIFAKEDKHYITIYMIADWDSGEPEVLEPENAEKWGWYSWKDMPRPLFLPIENLLKSGFDPFK